MNLNLNLEASLKEGFAVTDGQMLDTFAHMLDGGPPPGRNPTEWEKNVCYSSSTAVAILLVGTTLGVAHVGDSRAAIGRRRMDTSSSSSGAVRSSPSSFTSTNSSSSSTTGALRSSRSLPRIAMDASFLTLDHKPNLPGEAARITASGGSIVYLHGGKPFLRGGDFTAAQAAGRKPMQLNYSRAFGGMNLKPYGLSSTPDFTLLEVNPAEYTVLILGSDGLWDIFADPAEACTRALDAHFAGNDPSLVLTEFALAEHIRRHTEDNVTCIVIVLKPTL